MPRLLLVLCLVFAAPIARATPLFDVPADSLGHWVYRPATPPPGADLGAGVSSAPSIGALRAALVSGVITDDTGAWLLSSALAMATLAEHPNRGVMLDFDAQPEGPDGGMDIRGMRLVIEVRADSGHDRILSNLRAILMDRIVPGGDEARLTQRTLDLPRGRRGVSTGHPAWEEWQEISWHSSPGVFTIGVGRGSLSKWFTRLDAASNDARALLHRRAFEGAPGERVFEAYLNLDVARRVFPEAFTESRPSRLLDGWSLSSARDLMLHARRVPFGGRSDALANGSGRWPDLVAMDITWSARADRPGTIYRRRASLETWAQAGEFSTPPRGSVAFLFRNDLPVVADGVVEAFLNSRKLNEMHKDRAAAGRWMRANGSSYRRLLRSFGPHLVLCWDEASPLAAWSSLRLIAPIRTGVQSGRVNADLGTLAEAFPERVRPGEDGATWSFRLLESDQDPGSLLRLGTWGVRRAGGRDAFVWALAPRAWGD